MDHIGDNKLPIYSKTDKKTMKTKKIILTRTYVSPCGRLRLGALDGRLCLCDWEAGRHSDRVDNRLRRLLSAEFREGNAPVLEEAAEWLDGYFGGKRTEAPVVPLLPAGTEFQKTVWNTLRVIPWGQVTTYGDLARRIGMPSAVRAVANACGANGLSIFIPCHRVIGRDRSLTGYAGGLPAKKYLLRLEKADSDAGTTLETGRLLLRPWCPEDAEALYRYASDSRVSELALWPRHTSPEMSCRVIEEFFMPNPFTFAVTLKETGEPVGCIGLVPQGEEHYTLLSGEREVGYWIGRPFWGQGLIPEALEALGAFCRDRLGLASLLITADARNRASIRVAEKCGFLFLEEYLFEGIPSRAYRKIFS